MGSLSMAVITAWLGLPPEAMEAWVGRETAAFRLGLQDWLGGRSQRYRYRGSQGPLHLLVDSTGIKIEGEGEWNARKHRGSKRRVWRKIHIGIDKKTLEIRAAEFTTGDLGDAPMLPELLDQIPPDQEIGSVTADGAFDTRKCHEAIPLTEAVG